MKRLLMAATCTLLLASVGFAQESESTASPTKKTNLPSPYLGVQMGSMGFGMQFVYPVKPRLNLRLAGSYFQYSMDIQTTTSRYETDRTQFLKVGGVGLIADYAFLKTSLNWKLAAGLFYQVNQIGQYDSYTYVDNGNNEDLGTLDIDFTTFPVAPYAGLVFGNFNSGKRVTIALELGTLYHGKPRVEMTGTGPVGPSAENADLIESNVSNYNWFPYGNFQINYHFNKK